MKKTIFTVIFLCLFSVSAVASDFCDGFERGYITGYKQASGSSLDPLTPLCPLQPLKDLNDPESNYEQGYIIGYEKGLGAGRER